MPSSLASTVVPARSHKGTAGESEAPYPELKLTPSACAVFGGTYVLGPEAMPEIEAASADSAAGDDAKDQGGVQVKVPAHPTPLRATHLVTSPFFLAKVTKASGSEKNVTAHAVAVVTSQPGCLKRPAKEDEEAEDDDTGVVIFPPTDNSPLVRALIMGEGTGSCPAGQWVVYLSSELEGENDPKELLRPYLEKIGGEVAFEAYYLAHRAKDTQEAPEGVVLVQPYSGRHMLTEGLDWEAEQGEKAFRAVLPEGEFFPKPEGEEDEDE